MSNKTSAKWIATQNRVFGIKSIKCATSIETEMKGTNKDENRNENWKSGTMRCISISLSLVCNWPEAKEKKVNFSIRMHFVHLHIKIPFSMSKPFYALAHTTDTGTQEWLCKRACNIHIQNVWTEHDQRQQMNQAFNSQSIPCSFIHSFTLYLYISRIIIVQIKKILSKACYFSRRIFSIGCLVFVVPSIIHFEAASTLDVNIGDISILLQQPNKQAFCGNHTFFFSFSQSLFFCNFIRFVKRHTYTCDP